jgi:hypothetical protein
MGRFEAKRHCATEQATRRYDRSHEGQLPNLNAQIEEQKSDWDSMMRQPHFGQGAGKAEAVQDRSRTP